MKPHGPDSVILNEVKDLLYLLNAFEQEKQILRRGVYPEHGRRAPQNDIAKSLRGDGSSPIFKGGQEAWPERSPRDANRASENPRTRGGRGLNGAKRLKLLNP